METRVRARRAAGLSLIRVAWLSLALVLSIGAGAREAGAYVLSVDLDSVATPGPGQGLPGAVPLPSGGLPPTTGSPDFIESAVTVASGATLRMTVYLIKDPGTAALPLFDTVGADLSWGLAGDTATAAPVPFSVVAGGFAGSGVTPGAGFSDDVIPGGGIVAPGWVLATGAGAPMPGNAFNLGGVAYADPIAAPFTGLGSAGGLLALDTIDLFTVDLTVTGSPGDTVTLTPGGIFTTEGGSALFNNMIGESGPLPSEIFAGTVTIAPPVPEPAGVFLFAAAGGLGLWFRRRTKRMRTPLSI